MLGDWLQKRKRNKWAVDRLTQGVLAQALRPEFFGPQGVRDTFGGRFEMAALHGVVVFRRLRRIGPAGASLAQEAFDAMFDGFDDALREIGAGDLSVGRKIRKLGEAFYGRARAYDAALSAEAADGELAAAIARNVGLNAPAAGELAAYVHTATKLFDRQQDETLLTGETVWPRPVRLGERPGADSGEDSVQGLGVGPARS